MPTLGSDGGFQADNRGGIIDDQGNTIVTSDTSFAASPLGVAARTQALYGIPNANFNLTPPDPDSPIVANQNDLPYWSIEDLSDGQITATTVFDDATQTYGVELNPGTAATSSSLTLSTRSYILTDDNLALRQKALSVISKSGTAGGTASQWNLQLSAIYYDANDTALSTAVIGTALDTATWTSFSGTTTPGGSAINSAAQYVDLTYTLATTAAVTGSVKATIKSLLLTTTSPTTGGGFLVTEAFTSSGTWTRPSAVDYVSVIAVGGGGGGASGALSVAATALNTQGSGGGGASRVAVLRDIYVGDVGSVSIGVAAGGSGGTARVKIKGIGTAFTAENFTGVNGSAGGATNFGTYLTVGGGGGGIAGTAAPSSSTAIILGGTAAGPSSTNVFDIVDAAGGAGGRGATTSTTPASGSVGETAALLSGITQLPLTSTTYLTSGSAGGAGAVTKPSGTAYFGVAGSAGASGWIAGGGGGASLRTSSTQANGTAGAGGGGGGGGGGASAGLIQVSGGATGTVVIEGGSGGAGGQYSGAGGGAGGASFLTVISAQGTATDLTASSGAGGVGGDGFVIVGYTA